MTIYLSDRTGASIDTVLDDADAGNIGKTSSSFSVLDSTLKAGFYSYNTTDASAPDAFKGTFLVAVTESATSGTTRATQTATTQANSSFIRINYNGTWSAWKELYAKGTSKTNAQIDTVIDDADASNVGKLIPKSAIDFDTINSGFSFANTSATNGPVSSNVAVMTIRDDGTRGFQVSSSESGIFSVRSKSGGTYSGWEELYHTGNTGVVSFNKQAEPTLASETVDISPFNNGQINFSRTGTASKTVLAFYNANGQVGLIATSGTATAYNTSSDPRLKDFTAGPSDTDIDSKFNDLFGAFRTFNWKSDPTGDLVWGFDAHATIDAGLDVGSEGEGPRELALGDVYNTTPAVFEDQEVPLLYKSGERLGQPRFDSEGIALTETVSVEVTAAIEHKVSPAGVDQSKAVPILLAKIEQLERRLVAAGL